VWYWKYTLRRCILKHIGAGRDADGGAVAGPQVMRMRAFGRGALLPARAAVPCGRAIFRAQDFGEQCPFNFN